MTYNLSGFDGVVSPGYSGTIEEYIFQVLKARMLRGK
jgi:hypothetical protein